MSFLRALLGRSKPVKPDLDRLFGLPSAAVTLQATAGLRPTGTGSVAFRAVEGQAFATLQQDVTELLNADAGPAVQPLTDEYGYTWLVVRTDPASPSGVGDLVTDLHAVNSSLESAGYGPSLLCSLVAFADGRGRPVALVYLYKRGTFYPFAPLAGQRRDTALELQVAAAVGDDLQVEADKSRWFPVYGAPGLTG
ncbi:PspA-associated protein PspAB [Marinitenerispora sediminis]|uniref:Uncharacterized protein n=1 Tax=Marinitenerispora sediminis TaxID=1931232 RepID=A0A368SXT4_9ACTN|nr:hypothetical protein [Marinitenerispora sediminis]RCV47677.1 hypothetical protein DEF24_26895 [Marinitenerispora sediminis]RCV54128.1 hypothetical protein DEF28_08920 [Marinitenerispora sediminis]RCV56774.1 hypothetical protein DEF23_11890 [Marinitenerispora sediminis]